MTVNLVAEQPIRSNRKIVKRSKSEWIKHKNWKTQLKPSVQTVKVCCSKMLGHKYEAGRGNERLQEREMLWLDV